MVDESLYEILNRYKWHLKKSFHCWYVVRRCRPKIKKHYIRLHRIIALTPPNLITHHRNLNTLDNRTANLLNITELEHAKYYSYR